MKRFYFSTLVILAALLLGSNGSSFAQTTFSYTGSGYATYTVPAGVTSVHIDMSGGSGGNSSYGYGNGGKGGRVQCSMVVTSGQVLNVYVGGQGASLGGSCCSSTVGGGYNGGGASGAYYYPGSGGGESDIRVGGTAISNRVVVAGGGGGVGGANGACTGGDGGGLTGLTGQVNGSTTYSSYYNATGGSQTAGGIATDNGAYGTQPNGSGGLYYAGGGGGGYWGGGGGYEYSGGGGGSSYPAANGGKIAGLTHTQGYQSGNGYVIICPGPITGTIVGAAGVCPAGATTTLSDTTAIGSGSWSSSNLAVATIGSSSGIVTGLLAGTTTISYTIVGACTSGSALYTMKVYAKPNAYNVINGGSYCAGGAGADVATDGSDITTRYQLYNGSTQVGTSVTGTGSGIDFGFEAAAGTYTVADTLISTGCGSTLSGSANVSINPLPNPYVVKAGGVSTGVVKYCAGGTLLHVTLSSSDVGFTYQLFSDSVAVAGGSLAGTGSLIDFGPQSAIDTYTVAATNTTTGCTAMMTGNPVIGINPVPVPYSLTGGGHYCAMGTGAAVSLSNSQTGSSYQLYDGAIAEGTPVMGTTGTAVNFGLKTDTGTYTVIAIDTATHCSGSMSGSVAVVTDPLPDVFSITGGGDYCAGSGGKDIQLNGSASGINYQLYNGIVPVAGALKSGTGGIVDYGNTTAAGSYTIIATSTSSTHCSDNMAGSVTITINPLPPVDTVLGGGGYCVGGAGKDITLSFSNTGVNYQLYNGVVPVGGVQAGTGLSVDFGLDTAGGTYTVRATNATTGCNSNMYGSAVITVHSLPVAYLVSGGGNYCSLGSGLPVGLKNSDVGVNYMLYNAGAGALPPSVAGTGSAISFGNQTLSGAYTVVATNSSSCTSNMTGSVTININPLPTGRNVTGGGGYCTGGTGLPVGLDTLDAGVSYQLLLGGVPVPGAPVLTGPSYNMNFGTYLTSGTYTVHAANSSTTCNSTMLGSATITINPSPNSYAVSGGGNYCAGSIGKDVYLPFSNTGISYQLSYNGSSLGIPPVMGTGALLHLGVKTDVGAYTVAATNVITGCTSNMSGSVNITATPSPAAYTMTGSGGYCPGMSGIAVGLSGSNTGVSYQLYDNGLPTGVAKSGTNATLRYGVYTAGVYSIIATDAVSGCTSNMITTDSIYTNPLPAAYSVSGGGGYCTGDPSGDNIYLGMSDVGVTYGLYLGGVSTGTSMPGTGSMLDFNTITTAGTYTIVAIDGSTSCTNNMTGSAVVSKIMLPLVYTITGGGSYCSGGSGKDIMLSGSNTGISYQLFNSITGPVPPAFAGTNKPIDFGLNRNPGNYTIVATDGVTSCISNMIGSPAITVNPLPNIDTVTGGGHYCDGATPTIHVGLNNTDGGILYQLYVGGAMSGAALPGTTGASLDFGAQSAAGNYTVIASDAVTKCNSVMADTASIVIDPKVVPSITASSDAGVVVCAGTATNFTAAASGDGASPAYQWILNGASVPGATNSTFMDTSVNTDVVSVLLTSDAACALPVTALSNLVAMTVNPNTTPTATILMDPTPDSVCKGTSVEFTAVPHNAGTAPSYAWTDVSGSPAGSAINTTMDINASGKIMVTVTSNDPCRLVDSAVANVNMTVVPPSTPVLAALSVSPSKAVNMGQIVTITATVTSGGGPAPAYEWFINGVPVPGQNTNKLVGNDLINGVVFNNDDSISCVVTGSGLCGGIDVSRSVTITVRNTTGINQVTSTASDVRIMPNPNKGAFTIKGNLGTTDDQKVSLEISDMLGQVVYKHDVTAPGGNLNEQVQLGNNLANGMYILNVRSGTENSAFHFVIEQ